MSRFDQHGKPDPLTVMSASNGAQPSTKNPTHAYQPSTGGLVRRSIVFIPHPPDLPTFSATHLNDTTLLVFAKAELENPIQCWRITLTDGTLSSAPLQLTGCTDRVQPGFQAIRAGSNVVLLGGYSPNTSCTDHLDVFICKQRGTSLHVERLSCSGARIPSPRTYAMLLPSPPAQQQPHSPCIPQAHDVAVLGCAHRAGLWRLCHCPRHRRRHTLPGLQQPLHTRPQDAAVAAAGWAVHPRRVRQGGGRSGAACGLLGGGQRAAGVGVGRASRWYGW